jgi:hypothetical protein
MVSGAALASPRSQAKPFRQPLLVPGAVWSFDDQLDLLHPQNAGTTLHGSFTMTGQSDNELVVTWQMATEKQVLTQDVFANKIFTASIADLGAGVNLALTPQIVHFAYPLSVGQTFGDSASFSGVLNGVPLTGTLTSQFTVVREDSLVTPAGTFDALVLVNDMAFPALGEVLQATLWVTSDGLLVKRESRINGQLVQVIVLSGADVPVPSMVQQLALEVGLVRDELKREQRDDIVSEAALQVIENTLDHSIDHPSAIELAVARDVVELFAARLKLRGAADDAPVIVAAGVIENQISLTIDQLRTNAGLAQH